jgi:hypothetical protein
MIGLGSIEMVVLLALFTGGGDLDIVSTLPAKEYFKARDVEISAERLMDLASQTPDTGKKQIAQLMALNLLANDTNLLKNAGKAAEYRKTLEDIAQGKKANDSSGFAAEYARRTLRALTGEKAPLLPRTAWKDAMKFLPGKASLVGFVDPAAGAPVGQDRPDFAAFFKMMPKDAHEAVWSGIEKTGNMKVDHFSFAVQLDPENGRMTEFVIRVVGKFNPEWLAASMPVHKEDKRKERTFPDGAKVRFLIAEGSPAIALVGDRELLLGSYPLEFTGRAVVKKGDNLEILERMLDLRGKGAGALGGNLNVDLATIPADANVVIVGDLPIEKNPGPVPAPLKFAVHAKRIVGGIDIHARGVMANEADAKTLLAAAGKLRDLGLQQMKNLQGQPGPFEPAHLAALMALVESIELQTKNHDVTVRAFVPEQTFMILPTFGAMRWQAAPPPPPAKK